MPKALKGKLYLSFHRLTGSKWGQENDILLPRTITEVFYSKAIVVLIKYN